MNELSTSPVACGAAFVAAAIAAWGAVRVRGSTAVPAAAWAAAACLALALEMGARAAGGLGEPGIAAATRLAVVALGMCPTMSLLGAKRPQHGVWQFIVATLWVVLAWPAVSAVLVRPGSLPDVHLIERCFMPLLILVGWMNFAGTRRAAAATLIVTGHMLLARAFLPGVDAAATLAGGPAGGLDALASILVMLGACLAALPAAGSTAPRQRATSPVAAAIDPPFLALRETLGAAWALRIAERFDTVAAARGWPCRLTFAGLETGGDSADASWHRDALRAFQALARRFATDAWLSRHGWQGPG